MSATTLHQLEIYGPDRCDRLTPEQARNWCMKIATGRYENFSVLSAVVPKSLRGDFAAVSAFCRWADDLGDEMGSRDRARELLAWWRRELQQCFGGQPRHPVFLALEPTIRRHSLPIEPFDHLIQAFEQDQSVDRYQTWDQLIGYCKLSADPVGRLVLMMSGEDRTEDNFTLSVCIFTALQLTNHWQDVRRDAVERNRIYIPRDMMDAPDFEQRLIGSARQGFGVHHAFLEDSRRVVRQCVTRTWPLYEKGLGLLERVGPQTRPIVWLFAAGGQHVLRKIEQWSYETALHRPTLTKLRRVQLVAKAWLAAKTAKPRRAVRP